VLPYVKDFGQLNRLNVTANMTVVTQEQFPDIVTKPASETCSQMAIIPDQGVLPLTLNEGQKVGPRNPFDGVVFLTRLQT
jgi:hypothetical protein